MARKAPDLANYFSAAKQSQQLGEAEAEIQRLKAEIEKLRQSGSAELEAQLQALRSQLRSQSGILLLSILIHEFSTLLARSYQLSCH